MFGVCKGAFAEYASAPEARLVPKPESMSFDQAAALPVAGLTALQGLRDKGRLQLGQNVLINGAAGGVGTFAVQIAKSLGANVTGVCSTKNVELVRSLGADRVIDYTRDDFTEASQRYDLLLANVGNRTLSAMRRVLSPSGRCVMAGAPKELSAVLTRVFKAFAWSRFMRQKFTFFIAKMNRDDLTILCGLIKAGKVTTAIDRRYPLTETAAAISYVEEGHAPAKVIITFNRRGVVAGTCAKIARHLTMQRDHAGRFPQSDFKLLSFLRVHSTNLGSASYARTRDSYPTSGRPSWICLPKPGERILDLGCGDGVLTKKLADLGCEVVAVDSSLPQVEAARKLGERARNQRRRAAIPIQEEFDAVFSNAVLHWIRGADLMLGGVYRSLKPGGRFVAECGGHGCVHKIRTALVQALDRRGFDGEARVPWYFPTPGDYAARLERAGFRVDSIALIPRPTPLPGDIIDYLETFARNFFPGGFSDEARSDIRREVRTVEQLRDANGVWVAGLRTTAIRGNQSSRLVAPVATLRFHH